MQSDVFASLGAAVPEAVAQSLGWESSPRYSNNPVADYKAPRIVRAPIQIEK